MPKFGVSTYSVSKKVNAGEFTPEQGIKWLCENGAEVIEVSGIDFMSDKNLISRVKNVADGFGVPLANYSLGADFLVPNLAEELDKVKAHMNIAKELGALSFRSDCAPWSPSDRNSIENFINDLPKIAETYNELAEYAATIGLKLLIENHGFHANGAERVRLILKGVKSSNFGLQLDVGNFICMDDKPEVTVKTMIPFAAVVHMKDFYVRHANPGDANSWIQTVGKQYLRGAIFGQGDLDIPAIVRTVKDYGYDGNIFIEYEGLEDCLYGTKVSLDNLKRIWSEV